MIPVFKKILFATDLSENSRHAFFFAASMAIRYDAEITILHVREKIPLNIEHALAGFLGEERWHEMQKAQETNARKILIGKRTDHELIRKALDTLWSSAGVGSDSCSFDMHKIIVKSGKVVDEIIKTAGEKECDVIVIGAHKGLLGATAVSGVAKGVLHQARVPVLVVPPPEVIQAEEHR